MEKRDLCLLFWMIMTQFHRIYSDNIYLFGPDRQNIKCDEGEMIHMIYAAFNKYTSNCPDQINRCENEVKLLMKKCNRTSHCQISTEDYSSCRLKPREVFVSYKCAWWGKFHFQINYEIPICGDLEPLSCWMGYIFSNHFSYEYFDSPHTREIGMKYFNKCFVDHFKNNCDNRYLRCVGTEIPMDTFCFYFPFSLHVVYRCVAKDHPSSEENQRPQFTFTTSPQITAKIMSWNKSKSENRDIYDVGIWRDGRIILTHHHRNDSFTVCANNWTDPLASIVCKYLNISETGKAGFIDRNPNLKRISYGFQCEEGENDPYKCEPDLSDSSKRLCESIGDATVTCLETNDQETTGMYVGGTSMLIVVLVLLTTAFCIRHKRNKKKPKPVFNTGNINSLSEVGVSNYSNPWDESNEVQTESQNQNYFVLEQQEREKDKTHYMSAIEGVYDVSNDRRYKNVDDVKIYDHSISEVYDVASRNRLHHRDDGNMYDQTSV